MKYTIVDELPRPNRITGFSRVYAEAIDVAVENEPKWVRLDALASSKQGTASGRVRGLQRVADEYVKRTGLSGRMEVVGRRVEGATYPFIRKLPVER